MNVFCVIPARGGSKRIPRKNLVDFWGKPIIGHAIETAKGSELIKEVFVSTEDTEISNVAKRYGAKVPRLRPKELADDFASTNEVIKDAISMIGEEKSSQCIIMCLYPTAVLMDTKTIDNAIRKFLGGNMKLPQISIARYPHPIERAFKKDEDHYLANQPENIAKRTQDIEEKFFDAGQFYIGTSKQWTTDRLKTGPFSGYILSRMQFVDIDTIEDLEFAKKLHKLNYSDF